MSGCDSCLRSVGFLEGTTTRDGYLVDSVVGPGKRGGFQGAVGLAGTLSGTRGRVDLRTHDGCVSCPTFRSFITLLFICGSLLGRTTGHGVHSGAVSRLCRFFYRGNKEILGYGRCFRGGRIVTRTCEFVDKMVRCVGKRGDGPGRG